MVLKPAQTKCMLLSTGQKHQLRPLTLKLSLENNHIEHVHEHRYLSIISDDESTGDRKLLMCAKQYQKPILITSAQHFVDTSRRKLFYHAYLSAHLTYTCTVLEGYSGILFKRS